MVFDFVPKESGKLGCEPNQMKLIDDLQKPVKLNLIDEWPVRAVRAGVSDSGAPASAASSASPGAGGLSDSRSEGGVASSASSRSGVSCSSGMVLGGSSPHWARPRPRPYPCRGGKPRPGAALHRFGRSLAPVRGRLSLSVGLHLRHRGRVSTARLGGPWLCANLAWFGLAGCADESLCPADLAIPLGGGVQATIVDGNRLVVSASDGRVLLDGLSPQTVMADAPWLSGFAV